MPAENSEIDLQIAEVISRWMESAQDSRPSVSELIERHPGLAPGLAECLQGLERIELGKLSNTRSSGQAQSIQDDEIEFPVIPDFEVLGELGRGGMGVVYEAKQISLDRIVALKVLPFAAVAPRAVKRFLREAETVAALSHPGIVPIYAVGVHEGLNWFAMQRIDGCPLSQWFAVATFESRPAAMREVVRVGIEAAEALEHAHQRGVIHRDVKPGNLLVDTTGKVWLTDFGLARRDVDVTATLTGAMLGTPRYMSAEQISGRDELVDARTDIYSLGATLYEMSTGRPPFTSQSPLELLTQIQRDEPTPPRQIDPAIPRTLELVILKCLDKEPKRRYASAAALADDLKAIRDDRPIAAKGVPAWLVVSRFLKRNNRQVNAVAMTAIGTVVTLVAAALLWQQNVQARVGLIRINTPAGLYVANIQPTSVAGAGKVVQAIDSTLTTTPMQLPMSLPAGDYTVRLEGNGHVSQTLDVVVVPRDSLEIDYVDRRDALPEVDIHQKLSVPMRDNTLAVLSQDAFTVFDPQREKNPRFALPIKELDDGLVDDSSTSDAGAAAGEDSPLTFAFTGDQVFQGDYTVAHSGFARIERIGTTSVDLNQDGQNDFLVTASRQAAIAAVSSNGTVLWKRRLPMTFEIANARSRFLKEGMPNEAIVGITPVDDVDNDGTHDLVINAAMFDPSGFSRPYIFTLSGRDGSELAVASFPTIDMRNTRNWPWSGLLRHRRKFNSDDRSQHAIQTRFENAMRSRSVDLPGDSWGGNSANSALYVLPPLVIGKHDAKRVAIAASDRAVHYIDLTDGFSAAPTIKLTQPILRGPQKVHLADGKLAVLVLTGTPGTSFTKCSLELCVLGEQEPRLSIPLDVGAYDLGAVAADSSFPLATDLDGDGNDELLCPTNLDVPFKWPQLNCYSASGQLQWTSQGVAGLSPVIDQALPVCDIDGDGIVDVVVVGLIQVAKAKAVEQSGSASKEGLRLTFDFLSGKSGQRLGYRDEYVAASVKNFATAEIDFVELSGHELTCSVVFGSQEELKLSSMSVTCDLTQLKPSVVARGLTALGLGNQPIEPERGRWFRRRSGPYSTPSDSAVWVARELKQTSFPGEKLVASWISPTKEPRVLLSSRNGLRCINPVDARSIWTTVNSSDNNHVLTLEGQDGSTDLIYGVAGRLGRPNAELGLFDGETGRLRFKLESPKVAFIHHVVLDRQVPERVIYAFAAAEKDYTFGRPLQEQGFVLMKIDRIAGRLLWSKNCYEGVNPLNPVRPVDPIQVDLNDDQVLDLITGDTKGDRLIVQAIDGRVGRTIWESPLQLGIKDWPWWKPWPMMTLIPSGNQRHLLLLDGVATGEKLFELKTMRLKDGEVLDSLRRMSSYTLRNDVQSHDLSLHVMAPGERDGIIGLATAFPDDDALSAPAKGTRVGQAFGLKLLHVHEQTGVFDQVETRQAKQAQSADAGRPMLGPPDSVLMADIDEDQSLDCIEYRVDGTVKIRSLPSDKLLCEFDVAAMSGAVLNLEQVSNTWYLKIVNRDTDCLWYELPSGRLALRYGQGLQSTKVGEVEYPRLISYAGGTLLVGSTPEAVNCVEVDIEGASSSVKRLETFPVAMIDAQQDPRYRRAFAALGMYANKSIADVIRLAWLTFGAILLPIGYVYRLIRRRRWSLQVMLLAPPVFLWSLVCWRSLQAPHISNLILDVIVGVMATLSVWAVFTLMRHQNWRTLAISVLLSMLMGTLMMFGAQSSISLQTPGMTGVWTAGAWFSSVCAAGAQLVLPMAVGVAWTKSRSTRPIRDTTFHT